MTIQEIIAAKKENIDNLIAYLCVDPIERDIETWRKEYDGDHEILRRKDKTVGEGDNQKTVKVAKLPVTMQEKIVETFISFMFGEPVRLVTDEKNKDGAEKLKEVFDGIKSEYFDRELARRLSIETKVAELWFVQIDKTTKEKKYRVRLLCNKNGDDIYPHFDEFGDMDAFIRRYNLNDIDNKVVEHVDIYIIDRVHRIQRMQGQQWVMTEEAYPVAYQHIPVIYYDQAKPEWANVQALIDRIEILISRHADTNDYYGNPILQIMGELENAPEKGEVGNVLQFKMGLDGQRGEAKFLEWSHSPESIELEYTNLKNLIYFLTSTPELSFENLKGIGNALSGVAIRLMFWDCILKRKRKEEIYGAGYTRRINLVLAMIAATDARSGDTLKGIKIKPKFQDALPENVVEIIQSLVEGTAGKPIISQQTAVQQNPLVENPETEIERLDEDREKSSSLAGTFNLPEMVE